MTKKVALYSGLFCLSTLGLANTTMAPPPHKVILFVWDGLRPDAITAKNTPNLYRIKQQGSYFSDNHASYPTFTMMNAATFATGDFAGKTGFFGNVLWDPKAQGDNAANKPVDFNQPVFTEDYKILADLDEPNIDDPLVNVHTLFQIAQQHGMKTATVGKSGPAFFQDYQQEMGQAGIVFDEKHVYPLSFAKQLQKQSYPIPKLSPYAFAPGQLKLHNKNGDPTHFTPVATLEKTPEGYPDHVTPDPNKAKTSPYSRSNAYLMQSFLSKIWPRQPQLSVVWLRNPDTTEHNYGPGSQAYQQALQDQDKLLGELLSTLKAKHQLQTTNLIIASDHSHSNVSGPLNLFPLRRIKNGKLGAISQHGFSVSGNVRAADLLSRAGFHAYDGLGCSYDPILSGILANGRPVYPTQIDKTGQVCQGRISAVDLYGDSGHKLKAALYTTPSYLVPKKLPSDAIIVANNGGSVYFYLPSHNQKLAEKLLRFLQAHEQFGPVFTSHRYGNLPGALSLATVKLHNPEGRSPDIIASMHFDDQAIINHLRGIEYNTAGINRGMHGSFSHTDVHNTLLAIGPDFKKHFVDPLPSGNVDVPNTIAHLLGFKLKGTDGRILLEALTDGSAVSHYQLAFATIAPERAAKHLTMRLPSNPNGHNIDHGKHRFNETLHVKLLSHNGHVSSYFDQAKERRW